MGKVVAGLSLVVVLLSVGLGLAIRSARVDATAAKITIAGLSALDSADKEQALQLGKQLAAADSARRADSLRFAASIAQLGSQLSDALVLARAAGKKRSDTVTVTVGVLEDAHNAVNACTMADNSCERNLSAERASRENAERDAARARAETAEARKLVPTRGQQLWHDTKVATVAVGTTLVVRWIRTMITGMIRR